MGGGCICDNYLNTCGLNSPDNPNNIISLEKGKDLIQNSSYNKITNKKSNLLYNILDKNKDSNALNKRYSDYHNYETKQLEKKNITNKISNIEGRNTSVNDASFLHLKNYNNNFNNNEENTKKMSSNHNSSNFNESNIFPVISKQKGNENIEEEEDNNTKNNFDSNNHKHQTVMNKIKKKEENNYRKSDTNINCNLGEHNFIFINISRGSSFMNNNVLEKFEATTPKMMIEKENNMEEVAKGNKNLFSHFCKNRMEDKSLNHQYNYNNQFMPSAFMPFFDMNKYSEEMLGVINSIRINPEFLIKHIDYLKENNISKTDEGIFLISHEVEEKIKLMDNYIEIFDKTKVMLRKKINSYKELSKLEKMVYNDDLEIILDETQNNEDDYDIECEEEEEEKEENVKEKDIIDIKNVSTKLNYIYDNDDICIMDDDNDNDNNNDKEENYKKNKNKSNENLNIIDFDNDDEETGENKNNIRLYSSRNSNSNHSNSTYKIIDDNNNDNDNGNINYKNSINKYKIIINNNDNNNGNINNNKIKKYKKKRKIKKKHNINNYLDLNDDKIANLILQKRKEIKKKYPKNIFKMSVIKDIKMSILIQIIMEEFYNENNNNSNLLKDIIFSPKFKNFAVSWTNEINRNFISISCFA